MTILNTLKFAFIGAGNMSGAILAGMIKNGVMPSNIFATNRSQEKQQKLHQEFGIHTSYTNLEAIQSSDVVILGVKPQMMQDLLNDLINQGADFSNKLVITVAAGLNSQTYFNILGNIRFIRCMPNTPSLVGLGVAGLFNATNENSFEKEQIKADQTIAEQMFNAVGMSIWLEQESGIDAIAAVSGSGPAYFFMFMEALTAKAEQLGFAPDVAKALVEQTALGSITMANQSQHSFAQLRKNVTSPGGTTAAALGIFEQHKLTDTVAQALDASIERAQQLSKL